MRVGGLAVLCCLATVASAVPPIPAMESPADGGWAQRRADLSVNLPSSTPADVTATEFEVTDPSSTVVYSGFEPRDGTGTHTHTTSPLPDAGFFTWRVRGVDDAGVVSSWSQPAQFSVDDELPSASAITATLDGGALLMTAAVATDTQSGVAEYHFIVSHLDQQDGGVSGPGLLDLTPPSPSASTLLGPGSWFAGVHVHDGVFNVGPTSITGPLVVPASATLAAPEFRVIRFDGGVYPTAPYFPSDRLRFHVDAGAGAATTGFAFIRRARGATSWELFDTATSNPAFVTVPSGDQDVRVSAHVNGEVTDWSPLLRVFVDEGDPRTPAVTASRDGGAAHLSWPATRDDSSSASGVQEYRVSRCCDPDGGSTSFANVPHVPDASITFTDQLPGFGSWRYSVAAVDRAGNVGLPAQPIVVWPPPPPTGLSVADTITNTPVQLSWDAPATALTWNVSRIDAADAGTTVGTGLMTPSFVDPAPDGVWSYEVNAVVGTVSSEPARVDGVVSDATLPSVSAPAVLRRGAREGELSWTASDGLSGLRSVVLERETDGVVSALGEVTSPFLDTPPDGAHRYRVVATDRADNASTSEWSAHFVTPGAGVQLVDPGELAAECGRAFETTLTASEPVMWALVSAPSGMTLDPATGTVRWTSSTADVGTVELVVTAQAATSSATTTVPIEVSCTPSNFVVGCTCDSGGSLWLVLAVVLARRRSPSRS